MIVEILRNVFECKGMLIKRFYEETLEISEEQKL